MGALRQRLGQSTGDLPGTKVNIVRLHSDLEKSDTTDKGDEELENRTRHSESDTRDTRDERVER